jgi:hypothetical protein
VPPGTWTVSGGELGEDLRKPPTDASPSAEIEFTLSKKMVSRRSYLPCPPRWGVGVCTGPASKSELFGNRSVPQRHVRVARKCSGDFLPPSPPAEKAPAKLWRAILQSASQLASLLDSRSDMPFARLFPFGVIKQQGSGASFSEISSHALLG